MTILKFHQVDSVPHTVDATESSINFTSKEVAIRSDAIIRIHEQVYDVANSPAHPPVQCATVIGEHFCYTVLDDRGNGERHVMQEWIEANQTREG